MTEFLVCLHGFLSNVFLLNFVHVDTVGLGFAELIKKFSYHSSLGELVKTVLVSSRCYFAVILFLLIYSISCKVYQYLDFRHFYWWCVHDGVSSSLICLVFQVYSLGACGKF